MPTALATSKRKFHRLLDGLTTSSTTSLTSLRDGRAIPNTSTASVATTARDQPPTKKSRLSWATSRTSAAGGERPCTAPGRNADSTAPPPSQTRAKPGAKMGARQATAERPRETPNYTPWSHEQFLARLQTFASVTRWTPKPARLGEVAWAKRGWTCESWNAVACKGGCHQRVAVRLRPRRRDDEGKEVENSEDLEAEVGEELIDKFADLIVTGHHGDCLWRNAGCKTDIYRVPMATSSVWQSELRQRYASLLDIEAHLPEKLHTPDGPNAAQVLDTIHPDLISDPSIMHTEASQLDTQNEQPQAAPRPLHPIALQLALHGWAGRNDSHVPLARCAACFQRLGLWLYTEAKVQQYRSQDSNHDDEDDNSLRLNPRTAHRAHCPWANPDSQAGVGDFAGLPACDILWRLAVADARRRKRRSADAAQAVAAVENGAGDEGGDGDGDDGGGQDGATPSPARSREEIEREDRARFSRLAAVRKAFTVKRFTGARKALREKEGVGNQARVETG